MSRVDKATGKTLKLSKVRISTEVIVVSWIESHSSSGSHLGLSSLIAAYFLNRRGTVLSGKRSDAVSASSVNANR